MCGLDVTDHDQRPSDEEAFEMLLALGFPFWPRPARGGDHEAEEEDRRREQAHKHAEAKAAARSSSKEENPEAYKKRVREEEEEEGEEGEPTVSEDRTVRGRRRLKPGLPRNEMANAFTESEDTAQTEVQEPRVRRCRRCGQSRAYYAVRPLPTCLRELAQRVTSRDDQVQLVTKPGSRRW